MRDLAVPIRRIILPSLAACAAQVFPVTSMGSVMPVSRANRYHTQRCYSNGRVCVCAVCAAYAAMWMTASTPSAANRSARYPSEALKTPIAAAGVPVRHSVSARRRNQIPSAAAATT